MTRSDYTGALAAAALLAVWAAVGYTAAQPKPTHKPANATPYCGYSNYRVPCTDEVIDL